jgi:hypothetical protein
MQRPDVERMLQYNSEWVASHPSADRAADAVALATYALSLEQSATRHAYEQVVLQVQMLEQTVRELREALTNCVEDLKFAVGYVPTSYCMALTKSRALASHPAPDAREGL